MKIYVKIIFISTFSFFLVFNRDFIRHADFSRISASNTASDDVTNQITLCDSHIEFLIQTYYILLLIF